MKQVNVLISTYNGEKYIEEQLNSILKQSYSNIKIYVRDDGSDDETYNIINRLNENNQIVIIKGTNVGYGSSFMQLLEIAKEGDYWAFCDQDDVWDTKKIENAVNRLEQMDEKKANMYFHNFELTDEQLNKTDVYRNKIKGYSFQMAITECLHMGFATVINKELRRLMLLGDVSKLRSHDWWAELIVMEFGNIYTDDYIGAKHRRIESSVSSNALQSRIRWFIGALKGKSEIGNITNQFMETFGKEMNQKNRKILNWFVFERYSFIKSLKKCFYIKRWRTSFASELTVRFLMLVGKI